MVFLPSNSVKTNYKTAIIKSVDNAFTLLSLFKHHKTEYTFNEMVNELNMSRGTVHRLLITTQARGLIEHNPETNRYQLGIKLYTLGNIVANNLAIKKEAAPFMRKVANQTGETLYLIIRKDYEALCIERIEGHNFVKIIDLDVGKRIPLNIGGGLKILLAYMNDQDIKEWLNNGYMEAWTDKSLVNPDLIWKEIYTIRENGYSLSYEDVTNGAAAIGAPIRDYQGCVIGAISISGSTVNYAGDKRKHFIDVIVNAGQEISDRLALQKFDDAY